MIRVFRLFLIALYSSLALGSNWRKGGTGGDTPYAKIQFSESVCECAPGLNSTFDGMCINATSNSSATYSPTCSDQPFWGVVFVTWCFAAVVTAIILSSGFGVFKEILQTMSALRRGRMNPASIHIQDNPSKRDIIKKESDSEKDFGNVAILTPKK
jgi:hypothetical protein